MDDQDKGQVNGSAAEVYEEFFVPALFQEWAIRSADAANIQHGDRVLDVACGTGIVSRAAADRAGTSGTVTGLDLNEGMLTVARQKARSIDFRNGNAESLPFDEGSFDAVICQFGLMFFRDRAKALREMKRVLRTGGRLIVTVWDVVENSPGYAALIRLLVQLFGEDVADRLRAPYLLGDVEQLRKLFAMASLTDVKVTTLNGTARFPSLESWMFTEIKGWVLADVLDDAQFNLLVEEAKQRLAPFVNANGVVAFAAPAHIVQFVKQ